MPVDADVFLQLFPSAAARRLGRTARSDMLFLLWERAAGRRHIRPDQLRDRFGVESDRYGNTPTPPMLSVGV
jgi:hypothetical protein